MRVPSWRSPVWLTCLPMLVLGLEACAPSSSLENLPPPCVSGYTPCASTGFCVQKDADPAKEIQRDLACNYLNHEVRQGGSTVVPVPGATPDRMPKVTTESTELVATPRAVGNSVVVDIQAGHGAALGEVGDHKVKIAAQIAGHLYTREFLVLVQAIAASPEGSDDNEGSENAPFRTFRKAASVASVGDTIVLRNDRFGRASEPNEVDEIVVPAGVNVRGQVLSDETLRTKLGMPLRLEGGATFDTLELTRRLFHTTANATVTVNNTLVAGGISVVAGAKNAMLVIKGGSRIITDDKTATPVLVEAEDATLEIADRTSIDHGPTRAVAPVLMLSGRRQHLSIHDDARIQSLTSPVAIQVVDAETVEIDGRAGGDLLVLGRVEIAGVDAMVTVRNVTFAMGVGGSGIVFAGGGTSPSLRVERTSFTGDGIVLSGPQSKATVRTTTFSEISRSGLRVIAGSVDLGTALEPGENRFWTATGPVDVDAPVPVGLQIDADEGAATVTSSASTFDGNNPGPCKIVGPISKDSITRGFWKISNKIAIDFY